MKINHLFLLAKNAIKIFIYFFFFLCVEQTYQQGFADLLSKYTKNNVNIKQILISKRCLYIYKSFIK